MKGGRIIMHMTLYRKWRPAAFTDVCGQEHITTVLRYEVANNRVNHAYLFCGSRGTGKTTCAKILSAAVNCEDPQNGDPCGKCPSCLAVRSGKATDVLEMDAASNTGVDYIRDIRDSVIYLPAELKYKVYIIDEVHMLSDSAFNALLKTLEEPPERVIFILATTEPHKIPATILSRCQRFDFRRIPSPVIVERLKKISDAEGIELTDGGARLIARLSEGGMRDSISLLELTSAYGGAVDADAVSRAAGIGGRGAVIDMVRAVAAGDTKSILEGVARLNYTASDIAVFWQELIAFYRDMLVVKALDKPEDFIETTDEEIAELKDCAKLFTREKLIRHTELLDRTYTELRRGDSKKKVTAEMALLRLTEPGLDSSNEALLERIAELERRLAGGKVTSKIETSEPAPANPEAGDIPAANDVPKPADEQPAKTETESSAPEEEAPVPEEKTPAPDESSVADASTAGPGKIANWGNIVDRFGRDNPMKASYLTGSSATYDGSTGTVTVRCSNNFGISMLSSPESIEGIKKALASANAKYVDCRVKITGADGAVQGSIMDDFIV